MLKEKFIQLISSYSKDERYNLYCWKEIEEKYSSKSRYYHNLEHLENMLKELDEVKTQILNLDSLIFAVYYHDIIYTATKSDNEVQSSLLFQKRITKTSFSYIQECRRAIEATKEHKFSEDHDTNLLLDCDLSILGKSNIEYTQYAKNIRKEYQIYPDFMYRKGRKKVLKSILALKSIYKTDFFIQKYEKQARENLELELAQLTS
ncbi:hypothetical protein [Cellulophaga sp. Hel_I_12]|uniref:HD domain-containing protein n=1 Tax=Cellulophaga sp. Hel_I_12 TaxID=1249972 RepID=UPI000646A8C4|nr:hypothetical protein [Cellulophaga sp. Hel_I_12]